MIYEPQDPPLFFLTLLKAHAQVFIDKTSPYRYTLRFLSLAKRNHKSEIMSLLPYFNPPAYLTDFTKENADKWSKEYISKWMTQSASTPEVTQFYNATTRSTEGEVSKKAITWTAFPNTVRHETSEKQRWKMADSTREKQDEYCEWSVLRNERGEIKKVVFTCEGPEVYLISPFPLP